MSQNRWKLLAGGLGISLVAVVAMANPQCTGVAQKDSTREPAPQARSLDTRPVAIPMSRSEPAKDAVKSADIRTVPIPRDRVAPRPDDTPLPTPDLQLSLPPITTIPSGKVDLPRLETPVSDVKPPRIEVTPPSIGVPVPAVVASSPPLTFVPEVKPLEIKLDPPQQVEVKLPEVTLPPALKNVTLQPELKKRDAVVELPLPNPVPASPPALPAIDTTPVPATPVLPKTEPIRNAEPLPKATPTLPTEPPLKDVKLEQFVTRGTEEVPAVRVVVQLGTGQSQFIVMRGEEVLLKAVSDSVEVRSPSEKGNYMAPLKAGGKVKFTAPGCEGTCDSLTVQPVSGEVELTGSVSVLCRQGKAETQMNGNSMKFRFGALPTVNGNGHTIPPTTVPLSPTR